MSTISCPPFLVFSPLRHLPLWQEGREGVPFSLLLTHLVKVDEQTIAGDHSPAFGSLIIVLELSAVFCLLLLLLPPR